MKKGTPKVDWEKLSKQLQEALAKEMKEVERLEDEISKLNDQIEDLSDSGFNSIRDRFGKDAVIRYLEDRLYEEMKKNEYRDEEIPF